MVERDDLWIIDKPAGMPIEPTRSGWEGTLSDWIRHTQGVPFVTHRLDAATSGLVVVARDRPAQVFLNDLFVRHAIGRRYLAVVSPPPSWTETTLRTPIDGRPAVSHVRVRVPVPDPIERAAGSALALAALVEITLETGRTRQIRRHLAEAGSPVVGETAAGARTHARLLLHAFELRLPGTSARGPVVASAPPPQDFVEAARTLGLVLPGPDSSA